MMTQAQTCTSTTKKGTRCRKPPYKDGMCAQHYEIHTQRKCKSHVMNEALGMSIVARDVQEVVKEVVDVSNQLSPAQLEAFNESSQKLYELLYTRLPNIVRADSTMKNLEAILHKDADKVMKAFHIIFQAIERWHKRASAWDGDAAEEAFKAFMSHIDALYKCFDTHVFRTNVKNHEKPSNFYDCAVKFSDALDDIQPRTQKRSLVSKAYTAVMQMLYFAAYKLQMMWMIALFFRVVSSLGLKREVSGSFIPSLMGMGGINANMASNTLNVAIKTTSMMLNDFGVDPQNTIWALSFGMLRFENEGLVNGRYTVLPSKRMGTYDKTSQFAKVLVTAIQNPSLLVNGIMGIAQDPLTSIMRLSHGIKHTMTDFQTFMAFLLLWTVYSTYIKKSILHEATSVLVRLVKHIVRKVGHTVYKRYGTTPVPKAMIRLPRKTNYVRSNY